MDLSSFAETHGADTLPWISDYLLLNHLGNLSLCAGCLRPLAGVLQLLSSAPWCHNACFNMLRLYDASDLQLLSRMPASDPGGCMASTAYFGPQDPVLIVCLSIYLTRLSDSAKMYEGSLRFISGVLLVRARTK